MDEYIEFLKTFEITPVDESFKSAQGKRVMPTGVKEMHVRALKNSFAQFNLTVTPPVTSILLLEERPHFPYTHPVDFETILRAAIDLPGLRAKLHPIGMVEDDDGVKKGDIILEDGTMRLRAYQTVQLTALVEIPEDAQPGLYEGAIRFYGHSMLYDEKPACEIKISVQVEDLAIPKGKNAKYYLNLWQHVFNIARHHEVRAYTPEHIEALRPYAKALGELGNKAATVLLSDIPWCGQGCYKEKCQPSDLYEYNYCRIYRKKDGAFRYDFSFIESYIRLMEEYGAEEVMFTGLYGIWAEESAGFARIVEDWPDAIHISYIDEADGCLRFMRKREEVEDYFRAIYAWIKEQGLLHRSYLMGDEVNYGWVTDGWTKTMENLHRLMPDIRMDWDLDPKDFMNDTYKDERVDIYTPQIDLFTIVPEEMQKACLSRIREGGKFLWSVCCQPPVMNSFLYTNLNEVRLHGLITEKLKADGFLRWNFTVWPENPRESLHYMHPGWPAGDTCFVYPGKGGQCLKSLRYLALRRGIEDFELAQMVKEKLGDRAEEVIERALSSVLREGDLSKWDYNDYFGREKYMSLENADYEQARNILIDALLGC